MFNSLKILIWFIGQEIFLILPISFNIKLIASAKRIPSNPSMVEISVYPKLIPHNNILSNVNDVYNAILFEGNPVGNILVHGKGAGPASTTSAIASNLIHILQKIVNRQPPDILNIEKQSSFGYLSRI